MHRVASVADWWHDCNLKWFVPCADTATWATTLPSFFSRSLRLRVSEVAPLSSKAPGLEL